MVNSGFPAVRNIATGTFVAGQEFFIDRIIFFATIQGDGNTPNIVSVTTDGVHGLSVGDTLTIINVATQTDYNLDIGVTVTAITSDTAFQYETTNHINSVEDTTGNARVLDPYTFDDITTNDLGVFVHLSAGLSALSTIESTRDGINYVLLANGENLVGDIFRSFIVNIGDVVNFRIGSAIDIEFGRLYREP